MYAMFLGPNRNHRIYMDLEDVKEVFGQINSRLWELDLPAMHHYDRPFGGVEAPFNEMDRFSSFKGPWY